MKNKWILVFTLLMGLFLLSACKPDVPTYVLPNLAGKTESEVLTIMDDYLVTVIVAYEENLDVETGYFSSFSDNLKAGDTYTPGQVLTVFIAQNYPILPDLAGKNEQEIVAALNLIGIKYNLMIDTDNTVPDQTFSRYETPFVVGSRITNPNTTVTVYIGYNDPKLPDLTGLMKHEIITLLNELMIAYAFEYVTDDTKTEDMFASFPEHNVNDFIALDEVVTINLYDNTFTKASESLFISKYVDGGTGTDNRAIELFNPLSVAVNLADYHIAIYENGSPTVTYIIALTGTLNPQETFVIVHSNADQPLKVKADLLSNQLNFDGNEVVQLRYKNNTYIDTIYQIGNRLFTFDDEIFVRKEHIEVGNRTFTFKEWSGYIPTYIEIVGSHPLALPQTLTFTLINRGFYDPLGGMILVTLSSINDGDTAAFSPGFTGGQRMRFLGIDTPETYPVTEPWGLEAKAFTTSMLTSASTIYLQSDPILGTSDTFGRTLGYIWVDGVLLNYELIKNGYSWNYLGTNSRVIVNNRYLFRWFQDAEDYAVENKLGIHS